MKLGIKDPVASLVMCNAFASTELVVSLHARKILTALDMVDWEEAGVEKKSDVKMTKLPVEKVKRSLHTWIPRGEKARFHDTMDGVGSVLSARCQGDWGKIKVAIQTHACAKDKDAMLKMTERICQFYKATRSGGRSKKI